MAQDRLTAIAEFAECLDRSPDLENRLEQTHHDRKRAAGVFLAVATVAHTDEFRCRIRCIANRATKAAAIQFGHLLLPPISASGHPTPGRLERSSAQSLPFLRCGYAHWRLKLFADNNR